MMSGRHRTGRTLGLGRFRVPIALAGLLALVGVTAISVKLVSASVSGCSGSIVLRVAATPEIAPTLTDIGKAWSATAPQVGGKCVQLTVTSAQSAVLASSLTVLAGSAIDVAAKREPTPSEDALPWF